MKQDKGEKGERSEITQMKTSRDGERKSSQSPKKEEVIRGHKAIGWG